MDRRWATLSAAIAVLIGTSAAAALAATPTDDITPSTNEQNKANGWAHFDVVDIRPGEVDVELVHPQQGGFACFEWRVDGAPPNATTNFNPDVEDGLWPYACPPPGPSAMLLTLSANETLEIRMVFGAEWHERFTWTPVALTADEPQETHPPDEVCKKGGWQGLGFRNQGQCVSSFRANETAGR